MTVSLWPSTPRELGGGLQGHGHRLPGRDHEGQGAVRSRGPVRVALPHPGARGQRDDATTPSRAVGDHGRKFERLGARSAGVFQAIAASLGYLAPLLLRPDATTRADLSERIDRLGTARAAHHLEWGVTLARSEEH